MKNKKLLIILIIVGIAVIGVGLGLFFGIRSATTKIPTISSVSGKVENVSIDKNSLVISFDVPNEVTVFEASQIKISHKNKLTIQIFLDEDLNQSVDSMVLDKEINIYYLKLSNKAGEIVYKLIINRHFHTFEEAWSSDDNYHWHNATCSHTSIQGDKGEHIWSAPTTTKLATETTDGEWTYSCLVCGRTKTETIKYSDTYLVKLVAYSDEVLKEVKQEQAKKNQDLAVAFEPESRDDYAFAGWNIGSYDKEHECYVISKEDVESNLVDGVLTLTAQYKKRFTVTFVDYDLSSLLEVRVTDGELVSIPSITPIRDGYSFRGWDYNFNNPITDNTTIIALYDQLYVVTFLDSDNSILEIKEVTLGASIEIANPYHEGYIFKGWKYGDNDPVTKIENVQSDMTFKAVYELGGHRVRFIANGAVIPYIDDRGEAHESQTIVHESAAIAPTIINDYKYIVDWNTYKAYAFTGWDKPFDEIVEDTDIHAVYAEEVTGPILAVKADKLKDINLDQVTGTYSFDVSVVLLYNGSIYGISLEVDQEINCVVFDSYEVFPDTDPMPVGKEDYYVVKDQKGEGTNNYHIYCRKFSWVATGYGDNAGIKVNNRKEALRLTFKINKLNSDVGTYWISLNETAYIVDENLIKIQPIMVSDYVRIVSSINNL